MKPVPAYRQPCFLPTPPTPDGNIDLAAPEPATAASTPLLCRLRQPSGYRFPPASCAGPVPPRKHFVLLFP